MKIALIGYGKMGKTIEKIAKGRGHQIVSIIDFYNQDDFNSTAFKSADVAIEFTAPQVCIGNYKKCFEANIPVVSGTTGWTERMNEVKELVIKGGQTLFWASNFSLGVNIFMKVNEYLAHIMNSFEDYEVTMSEIHHTQKLDAPSGTAITLAEGIIQHLDRKDSWEKEVADNNTQIAITSIRKDQVSGIHTIRYENSIDSIEITHDAKNRTGFALGAVIAAEFCANKKGMLSMQDLLKF